MLLVWEVLKPLIAGIAFWQSVAVCLACYYSLNSASLTGPCPRKDTGLEDTALWPSIAILTFLTRVFFPVRKVPVWFNSSPETQVVKTITCCTWMWIKLKSAVSPFPIMQTWSYCKVLWDCEQVMQAVQDIDANSYLLIRFLNAVFL